jgi:hypothetical protein
MTTKLRELNIVFECVNPRTSTSGAIHLSDCFVAVAATVDTLCRRRLRVVGMLYRQSGDVPCKTCASIAERDGLVSK